MKSRNLPTALVAVILASGASHAAVVSLSAGTYTEDFNGIGSTAAAGWDVRTGATTGALGTATTYLATPTTGTGATSTEWSASTGAFKNFAAATTGIGSSGTVQSAATDRALGIRQTAAVGDPGASFSFNFSTDNLTVSTISIDLQMLSVQTRSTTWTISYGIGTSPTSFTTLGTFADPGAFGSTTVTYTTTDFGTNLDDLVEGWFRVTALSASSGSGSRDSFAIDNFAITTAASVPEPAAALLGAFGFLCLLRRRR